jgi:hypothetical protein
MRVTDGVTDARGARPATFTPEAGSVSDPAWATGSALTGTGDVSFVGAAPTGTGSAAAGISGAGSGAGAGDAGGGADAAGAGAVAVWGFGAGAGVVWAGEAAWSAGWPARAGRKRSGSR